MRLPSLFAGPLLLAALAGGAAAQTSYPLAIENCGMEVVFEAPPQRAVGLGQNSTEIMLLLGLAERMVGTAIWVSPVLERVAQENARVPRLANSQPSFEAVVGTDPDVIAVQFLSAVGPEGRVGTRGQFADLGVPSYISPTDCATTGNARADGSRADLWNPGLLYREIAELAAIFDVSERGRALIARFEAREDAVRRRLSRHAADTSVLFWFSSPEVAGDAWVAGRNGASGYMAATLGLRNVIATEAEWPLVSWEAIATADPDIIVIGAMSRRNQPSDDPAVKRNFLQTDPLARELAAVRSGRIVEMDAQAMNPTIRTIDGLETLAASIERFGLLD
ncbi:ABC transporter substrate-binding protein [Aureimonas populi]|uniref:ABC transporter substrate-binding protein n=1 Tax=Aureimonas populi TaxID=1701758 RepID=A0ABW5CJQ3_9HYPH|nr:ABC transporter substrate-binding protein [Aureimonas populi]